MIPVNEPLFGSREKELLVQCIDTGWVSSEGPFVKQFEESFSALKDFQDLRTTEIENQLESTSNKKE